MKSNVSKKGFTLIELLIVIAIIAVLAVALLPNIFGAPQAKSRDARRVTDLEKLQNALVSAKNFDAVAYPATSTCLAANNTTWDAKILSYLGNNIPVDPTSSTILDLKDVDVDSQCTGTYGYIYQPTDFSFGVYSKMEIKENGNIACTEIKADNSPSNFNVKPTSDSDSCYAILVK